jgi:CubicO group peptidase (beta-lactamase class C family)
MFSGTIEGNFHPLVFQPGTSWKYGPGLDWAAKVVEKLTGLEYDEYQQQFIWQPLGSRNTTFFPARRGVTPDSIQETAVRVTEKPSRQKLAPGQSAWKFDCRDALGGAGLYSTANDYSKLLAALIAGGAPLLSETTMEELFRPQLGPSSTKALREWVLGNGPDAGLATTWPQPPQDAQDIMGLGHCLCGLVNSRDIQERRRKNTVFWGGLPNLAWFIDRESGVAATFFTQVMPVGDLPVQKLLVELENAIYKLVNRG